MIATVLLAAIVAISAILLIYNQFSIHGLPHIVEGATTIVWFVSTCLLTLVALTG